MRANEDVELSQNDAHEKVVMYGSPTCHMVPPVRSLLQRADVPFDYVDIAKSAQARMKVEAINDGYASVPTLEFPDGSTLTEPSQRALKEKLAALGYELKRPSPLQALTENLQFSIIAAVFLFIGLLQGSALWMGLGLLLLIGIVAVSWLT